MLARCANSPSRFLRGMLPTHARLGVQLVRITIGCCVILCIARAEAQAQEAIDPRLEYNVKAVSLYAFGRYVTWPRRGLSVRRKPFRDRHDGRQSVRRCARPDRSQKTLNGRTIVVRADSRARPNVLECHICIRHAAVLSEKRRRNCFNKRPESRCSWSVNRRDSPNRGGIINFYQSGSNIRFELNPDKSVETQPEPERQTAHARHEGPLDKVNAARGGFHLPKIQ